MDMDRDTVALPLGFYFDRKVTVHMTVKYSNHFQKTCRNQCVGLLFPSDTCI